MPEGASLCPFFTGPGYLPWMASCLLIPTWITWGGLLSVLEVIRAKTLLWNPIDAGGPFLRQIMTKAEETGSQVKAVSRQSPPLRFGSSLITFLNIPCPYIDSSAEARTTNDASVVFRVDFGEFSFLFTGDLEEAGENELLQSGLDLRADLLKVGHHGSKTSSSAQFLDAVRPKMAVVSADLKNFGGLPHDAVLGRLTERGVKVFWTGRDGAITVNSDGTSVRVRAGRTGEVVCY